MDKSLVNIQKADDIVYYDYTPFAIATGLIGLAAAGCMAYHWYKRCQQQNSLLNEARRESIEMQAPPAYTPNGDI